MSIAITALLTWFSNGPEAVQDAQIWGSSFINQMLKDGTISECFQVIVDGVDPLPLCI